MSLRTCLAVIVLKLFVIDLSAQNSSPYQATTIHPSSPEVASFGKYLEMPVSYSTGIPEISIPLYDFSVGKISLPISLSYHASGIRVEEAASWVGLGWDISSGPTLTRVVNGLPDDTYYGYMYNSVTVQDFNASSSNLSLKQHYYNEYANNRIDLEPDIFMFSILGYSGKFFHHQQQNEFIVSPYQNIKIETLKNGYVIEGFKITLPNGVICNFGKSENNSRIARDLLQGGESYITTSEGSSEVPPLNPHIVSWKILDIVAPDGKTINFFYQNSTIAQDFYYGGQSKMYRHTTCPGLPFFFFGNNTYSTSFGIQNYEKAILSHISNDQGDIYFKLSATNRLDALGLKSLDSIIIKNRNNKLIKGFKFGYDYFQSSDSAPAIMGTVVKNASEKRLALLFLKEFSETDTLVPYKFYYDTRNQLPNRIYGARDYWGFYNGKSGGGLLIPTVSMSIYNPSSSGYLEGADRTVDSVFAKAATLYKIQYPTGGSVVYEYESNTISSERASDLRYIERSGIEPRNVSLHDGSAYTVSGSSKIYSRTFEIPENVYGPTAITSNYGCEDMSGDSCPIEGWIKGITDAGVNVRINHPSELHLLSPGVYKLESIVTPTFITGPNIPFSNLIEWNIIPDTLNYIVGGLRIKKIISNDGNGNSLVRSYSYDNFNENGISSGILTTLPLFATWVSCDLSFPDVLKISSNSATTIGFGNGRIIMYPNVTEYYDDSASSFKTQYTLSYHMEYPSAMLDDAYGKHLTKEWTVGQLLKKEMFKVEDSAGHSIYKPVTVERNFYSHRESVYRGDFGVVLHPSVEIGYYTEYPYNSVSEWYVLDSSNIENYEYSKSFSRSSKTTSKYYYNQLYQLAETKSVNSRNDTIIERTWYPGDYSMLIGNNIPELVNRHNIETPIRKETSVNGKVLSGSLYYYNLSGLVDSLYIYKTPFPLLNVAEHDSDTVKPDHYFMESSAKYDSLNNLIEINDKSSRTAVIWGYDNVYPVGRVLNAQYTQIAYTSFETNTHGGWILSDTVRVRTHSLSGKQAYNVRSGFGITKPELPTGNEYIVTYWSRSGSLNVNGIAGVAGVQRDGWTLWQHVLPITTSAVTISGNNIIIDELRLYPKGAHMVTYTYNPLVGIESECSANNYMTYYEYDSFNRLSYVLDEKKNILKRICYSINGIASECN